VQKWDEATRSSISSFYLKLFNAVRFFSQLLFQWRLCFSEAARRTGVASDGKSGADIDAFREAALSCPIPAAVELIGEKWAFLILRGAFNGLEHFEEFQAGLGIARHRCTHVLDRHARLTAPPMSSSWSRARSRDARCSHAPQAEGPPGRDS
jgi:hypothetical protein